MKRRSVLPLFLMIGFGACSNLGLGEPDCTPPDRGISSANVLTVQAVPTAKYTPCINELRLGWDSVDWEARDGQASIAIARSLEPFLIVTVTEKCDVSDATVVESGYPDIERYEAVDYQLAEIEITIVPAGRQPLLMSGPLVERFAGVELEDRPINFTIDERLDQPVISRVNLALMRDHYVWIIDELDAEEGTVELRSNETDLSARGIEPEDALELIEDRVPEVFYRGHWYFTFDGGCITYEFDAEGRLAETVAADAGDALGFFPAFELRRLAEAEGFDVGAG